MGSSLFENQVLFCRQAREEEDSRLKRPLQRKIAKTMEEGNALLVIEMNFSNFLVFEVTCDGMYDESC